MRLEEERRRKEENYLREKEKWRQKRVESSRRASKFLELKRKRSNEKLKEQETKKILQTDDLWEELGQYSRNYLQFISSFHLFRSNNS